MCKFKWFRLTSLFGIWGQSIASATLKRVVIGAVVTLAEIIALEVILTLTPPTLSKIVMLFAAGPFAIPLAFALLVWVHGRHSISKKSPK